MWRSPLLAALGVAFALAGCGEKAQTASAAGARKADTQPYAGTQSAYMAPGWAAGDSKAWEAQLRNRTQAQNEYIRAGLTAK